MLECKALAVAKCLEHGRCVFSSPQHMTRLLGIEDEISSEVLFEWQSNLNYFVSPAAMVADSKSNTAAIGETPLTYWGVLKSSVLWTAEQATLWSIWLGKGFRMAAVARFRKLRAAAAGSATSHISAAGRVDDDSDDGSSDSDADTGKTRPQPDQVLFLPALNRMCSVLLEDMAQLAPYNNVWTLEDWTDFIFDHKFRNGEVITSQLILNGALAVVTSSAGGEALAVHHLGDAGDVRRLVDWKLMAERLDSHLRSWESELQDLVALRQGAAPEARRLERCIAANKLVYIQTQKVHTQLQQGEATALPAALARIDAMMEHFPGEWPLLLCEASDGGEAAAAAAAVLPDAAL